MELPLSPFARLWRQLRVRPRLSSSTAVGLLLFALLPDGRPLASRLLICWEIGAGLYLLLAWWMIWRSSVDHMRWRARVQDDGAAVVLFLTILAAIASLAAIVMELSGLKSLPPAQQGLHVIWTGATFAVSWLLVHTVFALHYAHVYYTLRGQQHDAPLDFPLQDNPVYLDFLYFSVVIGMTSQTADVGIAATRLRRLVMVHGIVAFVFNTTLLALTVNIAAGLLG